MEAARQSVLKWDAHQFDPKPYLKQGAPTPFYVSALGALFDDDCLSVLPSIADECIDTVFADPPFNLGKEYGKRSNDGLSDSEYVEWCRKWIAQSVRTLRPGGAFFLYNLPKWNVLLGAHLTEHPNNPTEAV